jgi:hypothetical protein
MPATNILIKVVEGREHHTTPTRMHQYVGDILGSGYMVVAEVEVYDQIFLKRGFVIQHFSEVDQGVLWREPG